MAAQLEKVRDTKYHETKLRVIYFGGLSMILQCWRMQVRRSSMAVISNTVQRVIQHIIGQPLKLV